MSSSASKLEQGNDKDDQRRSQNIVLHFALVGAGDLSAGSWFGAATWTALRCYCQRFNICIDIQGFASEPGETLLNMHRGAEEKTRAGTCAGGLGTIFGDNFDTEIFTSSVQG